MPLEIAALTRKLFLRSEDSDFSVGEINDAPFALVIVHCSVDFYGLRYHAVYLMSFRFEVMPEDKAYLRIAVNDLLRHLYACSNCLTLFA